jgi:hypothetical protein
MGDVRMSRNARRAAIGAGIGVAATMLSVAVMPGTALAASDHSVSRAGCTFKFHSGANYSWSEKYSGSCSGHAWIRVHWENGVTSSWRHDPSFVYENAYGGTSDPSDYQITWSEHKTQSNESAWRGTP